jgi:hypothetical protein
VVEVEEKRLAPLSRKELMNNAMNPEKSRVIPQSKPRTMKIAFFDLPAILINQIF